MIGTTDFEAGLVNYCREHLAVGDGVRLVSFAPISDGWETEVYTFTLVDASGREYPLILRVYPASDAAQKSKREFSGLQKLDAAGYPVPKVFHHSLGESWLSKPFLLMEKIDGQPMGAHLREASPAQYEVLLTQFCGLLLNLHRLDLQPFLPPEAAQYDLSDPHLFLTLKMAEARGLVETFGRYEFLPVIDWLAKQASNYPCYRLSVTHNDFHPFNILMPPENRAVVIDWGGISVADFRYDLAWTLLVCGTFGRPELRDQILPAYERLRGEPVEGIEFFEAIACVRRLIEILITLSAGENSLGMRPEAQTILRQQSQHVRTVFARLQNRTGQEWSELARLIDQFF